MSLINTALQAASVLMNSQNSQWQRERENERGLTALEIEGIRQEHQLKMAHLTQEFQKNSRWEEANLRTIDQRQYQENEYVLRAHQQRLERMKVSYYTPTKWVSECLPHAPAPFVVISLNPHQEHNPFKTEAVRIAPFSRIAHRLKERNQEHVNHLFTVVTTQEGFSSDDEALLFYNRELNCPCIVIYGEFTGSSFVVNALYAGMEQNQIKFEGNKPKNLGVKVVRVWEVSYKTIDSLKQTYAQKGDKYGWLEALETYTETHVGLFVQLMLDNMFSYLPSHVYEIKAPLYLQEKEEELTRLGIWEALKISLLERYEVLKERQKLCLPNEKEEVNRKLILSLNNKSRIEIKVPAVGDSITKVTITSWLKKEGDSVRRDEILCELESDKATFELLAEADGVLHIKAQKGDILPIRGLVCVIEAGAVSSIEAPPPAVAVPVTVPVATSKVVEIKVPTLGESVTEVTIVNWNKKDGDSVQLDEILCDLDSDKATFELCAEATGTLKIVAVAGTTLPIGAVVCLISNQNSSFIAFDPKSLTKNVNGEWLCNDLNGTVIKPFTFEWGRYKSDFEPSLDNQLPSFSSDALRVRDKSGKVGFISNQGKIIIPFEYDDADEMREGYAAVKKDGKWGLVDFNGNVCIPFNFDSMVSPTEGYVRFASTNSSLWKENEFRGIYKKFMSRFTSSSEQFEGGMKGGLMAVSGKVCSIKPIFRTIKEVEKGFIIVKTTDEEGGVIDVYGRIVIPFDGVEAIATLGNGCYFAQIEKKYYFFDLPNKLKIEINNERLKSELYNSFLLESIHPIESLSFNFNVIPKFDDGFISLGIQEKWSLDFWGSKPFCHLLLSDKGEIKALKSPSMNYDVNKKYNLWNECEYSEGIILKRSHYGDYQFLDVVSYSLYVNDNFELIVKSKDFYDAKKFSNGLAAVREQQSNWGFINKDFQLIIPYQFDDVEPFSEGLSFVCKDNSYFLINKNGEIILEKLPKTLYRGTSLFKDGCACIRLSEDETGLGIEEWAIINKEGKILVK